MRLLGLRSTISAGTLFSIALVVGVAVETSGRAVSADAASTATSATSGEIRAADSLSPWPSPRAVAERFDSLLMAGTPDAILAARALTTGGARRLFPLLATAQGALRDVIDTARSQDTVLDEQIVGAWAALKVRADIEFLRPFLGLNRLTSLQMVHFYQDSMGWKIADFEEIDDENAPAVPRTGPVSQSADAADGLESGLLPVSPLAPTQDDQARTTRLLLKLTARDGTPLILPQDGPGQRVLNTNSPTQPSSSPGSVRVIETLRPALADSFELASWDDTLAVYRASTSELDLTDKMLRTRAAKLRQGSPHDVETARRVWHYVSSSFDFKLGATLFATSREALRDMRGDCSEAAVLTTALLRAAGIPSRVVLGYATLEGGVWIGHAWSEAYLGGQWIGVDAALREFPAGPNRVALRTLSGAEDMKTEATNLMLATLANLDIQILEAWAEDEELPLQEHPDAAAAAQRFWEQVLEGMGR